jgi:penicillin amidase
MNRSVGSRLVTSANWLIGVLLVAALALIYWFGWRPLPQRSGLVQAPVSKGATVEFDSLGEPHIHAASEEDALFLQGYVTAQDRLFQMDGLRRLSAGDLAEIVGSSALESDRESRRMRLRRIAEAAYLNLPPPDRAALAAYARGVNAFLSTHRNNLPAEFALLRYQPRPWSGIDSMLIVLHMFRNLSTTWRTDIIERDMLRTGDAKRVAFLFPPRAGNEVQPGSNAWAVAGSRTASGKPLLSNDMHLEYSLPGIWYATHLQAPGLDVAGVALPGMPGIIVGHNQRIAWGFTNLQFDQQDLYIENIDERTGRYVYQGQVQQARPEIELIRVKGGPVAQLAVWVTRHGPLFVTENGDRMALRWVAQDPAIFQFPVLDYNKAGNWNEFLTAIARFPGPAQNAVYADVDGHIGYHGIGRLPARKGFSGQVPLDGSSGQFEWQGYIPFEQLPSDYDPPRGIIVTGNQNPFPPDYPYSVSGNFAPPGRSRQILDLLSAKSGWSATQMLPVQTDIYSAWLRFLSSQVTSAYKKRNAHSADMDQGVTLLEGWNGQMDKDWAAPLLIWLVYLHVRSAVAESAAPGAGPAYEFTLAPAAIEQLLRQRPPGWFHDFDEMLLRAFADALEEGMRMQGRNIQRWRYGQYLNVRIDNPVLHQIRGIGPYFDIGPAPMSGSSTTVKQTTRQLAPSMRMTADTADWDHSLLNLLTGESGQALSRHYRDQWDAYYAGRSFPMQFRKIEAKSTLAFQPAP